MDTTWNTLKQWMGLYSESPTYRPTQSAIAEVMIEVPERAEVELARTWLACEQLFV